MRFDVHKLQLAGQAHSRQTRTAILCLLAILTLMVGGLVTAFTSASADVATRAPIRTVDRLAPIAPGPASLSLADVPPSQYDSLPDLAAEFEVLTRNYRAGVTNLVDDLAPAKPFLYKGAYADLANATDCLATAAWYEAGDKPMEQRSVIQVVLNRVNHPSFPKSVCSVVFQGSERTTGCQFSFTCDGSMARRAPSPAAWSRAKELAVAALSGATDPYVGQATHYHADYVVPWWSSDLEPVAQVGAHIFYRWRGDRGKIRGPPKLAGEVARSLPTNPDRSSVEGDPVLSVLYTAPEALAASPSEFSSTPAAIAAQLDAPSPALWSDAALADAGPGKPSASKRVKKSVAAPTKPEVIAPLDQDPAVPVAQAAPAAFEAPSLAAVGNLGPAIGAASQCEGGKSCGTPAVTGEAQFNSDRAVPAELGNSYGQDDPAATLDAGSADGGQNVQPESTGQSQPGSGNAPSPDQPVSGQPAGNPVASLQ